MMRIIKIISALSLALLVAAPVLFYCGTITLDVNKTLMLAATIAWFASALCWMDRPAPMSGQKCNAIDKKCN